MKALGFSGLYLSGEGFPRFRSRLFVLVLMIAHSSFGSTFIFNLSGLRLIQRGPYLPRYSCAEACKYIRKWLGRMSTEWRFAATPPTL